MLNLQLCLLLFSCFFLLSSALCDNYKGACRCTSNSCDKVTPLGTVSSGKFVTYSSTLSGQRLNRTEGTLSTSTNGGVGFILDSSKTFQKIIGFGGAFTDAASVNLYKMTKDVQELILDAYYSDDGIQYSLGRIPIASCDFSTYSYSYDDHAGDVALGNFSISMDNAMKLPMIKRALSRSSRNITIFGSPWSAPTWMKTTGKISGGQLKPEYQASWALYFSKFIDAYEKEGVPIWGVTAQNEPLADVRWESMYFSAQDQRDFIKNHLGPTLRKNHPKVKIMTLDDQRSHLPDWAQVVLDSETAPFVDGIGVHWYAAVNDVINHFVNVAKTAAIFPDKFILATEACNGYIPVIDQGPKLGDWTRAELYAYDIIGDLESSASGWTDWNIILDLQGGPNHVKNFVDAPILVDTDKGDVFYKQPMYYALGHFAKFIPKFSQRISYLKTDTKSSLYATAFLVPSSGLVVVVVLNETSSGQDIYLGNKGDNEYANFHVEGHSINTFIMKSSK